MGESFLVQCFCKVFIRDKLETIGSNKRKFKSGQAHLRPITTQENKHGIGLDRHKIEPAHVLAVPIFCSCLNL